MSAILFLIPVSVAIAAAFLTAFIWAVRSGQFEDTCTPSMRVLTDDNNESHSRAKRKSDES
jgi:cbb3-type cytochrome oxidase maturation protein